ncbi:MAG: cation:proton antiporter [Candidatus Micrarchaeota archaeon]
MNWVTTFLTQGNNNDIILFVSFSLGIGMSILASVIGLTPAIGAFLAGSITASLPNGRTFERTMKPFTILFSALFFLSIGMLVNPHELFSSLPETLSMVVLFCIGIFFFAAIVSYLLSTSIKSAIFAGTALLPLGEFSLLIAKAGSGLVAFNAINLAATGVVVSTFLCTVALRYNKTMYLTARKIIPETILKIMIGVSLYFREILNTFEFNGRFNLLVKKELAKLMEDVARMLLVATLFFIAKQYTHFLIELPWFSVWTDSLAIGFMIAASLPPVFRIVRFLKRVLDLLSEEFSRTASDVQNSNLVVRNIAVAGILFGFYASVPHVVEMLMLPKTFALLSIIFAALSLLFLWSTVRVFSTIFLSHNIGKKKSSHKKS